MRGQAPLPQSADKALLFSRLGLTEHIHKLLLQQASAARDRLSWDPDNLTSQSRTEPGVTAPYRWDQLSETAKHREILSTVHKADDLTQPYYELGQYQTQVNQENWVARWYLWHSFRHRDNRNSRARQTATSGRPEHGGDSGRYYDPVYSEYR
ncbi:hypothetical protein BDV95DRAFT_604731 [Massariosphaeria phaeospora]|uniref:Uncharacterized protein n=1 Tax=Massariosphaeria phaeospora TaxID=100035 RepID=A0A7C8MQE6_9PLEO|nr:hypothetical protein BDV95DRAFT_604731 [Massariosphaeria phaeospora]